MCKDSGAKHKKAEISLQGLWKEGANRGKTNVNINGNAINGEEVYARIVGEAVSVSTGGIAALQGL